MFLVTDFKALETACNNDMMTKFKAIENELTTFMKTRMLTTERDYSKKYYVNYRGRKFIHHPSFPNEFPAIMTSRLFDAVSTKTEMIAGQANISFGVLPGTSDFDGIGYAYFLEVGTEYAEPRPWITYTKLKAKKLL